MLWGIFLESLALVDQTERVTILLVTERLYPDVLPACSGQSLKHLGQLGVGTVYGQSLAVCCRPTRPGFGREVIAVRIEVVHYGVPTLDTLPIPAGVRILSPFGECPSDEAHELIPTTVDTDAVEAVIGIRFTGNS
jgi:hypothetical protein